MPSKRGQIRMVSAKGDQDRYAVLSNPSADWAGKASGLLRRYYQAHRPGERPFPGQTPDTPMSEKTGQHLFEYARQKAGLTPKVPLPTLRHSFATHLLEGGVDLQYIQER